MFSTLPAGFGNENHFSGIVADGGLVEIAVFGGDPEPAAGQQVLDFVAEEIPQRPGEHQSLLTSARMLAGENHLHVIDLLRAMKSRHSPAHLSSPPVGPPVLRH